MTGIAVTKCTYERKYSRSICFIFVLLHYTTAVRRENKGQNLTKGLFTLKKLMMCLSTPS